MSMIKEDYFILIESSGIRGITAKEVAEHTGDNVRTVTNWLSRWEKKGYITKFKIDPKELSSSDLRLYKAEVEKEKDERWSASHRIEDRASRRGSYHYSKYRYRIDNTCKEWGTLKYDDNV